VLVVRSGDSLWSIAAASLRVAGTAAPTDAQVAQAWPRWWAANREAVGDDPDLLLPGTVLRPPADGPGDR
jgi:resuscitation-promoting factor RpfA